MLNAPPLATGALESALGGKGLPGLRATGEGQNCTQTGTDWSKSSTDTPAQFGQVGLVTRVNADSIHTKAAIASADPDQNSGRSWLSAILQTVYVMPGQSLSCTAFAF
jgi:hypothetical protein